MEIVKIQLIRRDGGTQARTGNNEDTIIKYAEDMSEGRWQWDDRNAVRLFVDENGDHWLGDGFHRVESAMRAGWDEVAAHIEHGSRRDAVLFAAGANADHGLARTRDDVQRSIRNLLIDPEWRQWSNAEIARRVQCSDKTVAAARGRLEASSEIPRIEERTYTRNGTTHTQAVAAPPVRPVGAAPSLAEYDAVLKTLQGYGHALSCSSARPDGLRGCPPYWIVSPKGESKRYTTWNDVQLRMNDIASGEIPQVDSASAQLIKEAATLGYTITPAQNGSFRIKKGDSPWGGAKDIHELDSWVGKKRIESYPQDDEEEEAESHALLTTDDTEATEAWTPAELVELASHPLCLHPKPSDDKHPSIGRTLLAMIDGRAPGMGSTLSTKEGWRIDLEVAARNTKIRVGDDVVTPLRVTNEIALIPHSGLYVVWYRPLGMMLHKLCPLDEAQRLFEQLAVLDWRDITNKHAFGSVLGPAIAAIVRPMEHNLGPKDNPSAIQMHAEALLAGVIETIPDTAIRLVAALVCWDYDPKSTDDPRDKLFRSWRITLEENLDVAEAAM
jgi:hypothetical protein